MERKAYYLTDGTEIFQTRLMNVEELETAKRQAEAATDGNCFWTEHKGSRINRWQETERFWERYGFEKEYTGGSCTAFVKKLKNGHEILITTPIDAEAPKTTAEPCNVSEFDERGNATDSEEEGATYSNAEEAAKAERFEEVPVRLIEVINDKGERETRGGTAEEFIGCRDDEGKAIAGGWSKTGQLYADEVDTDGTVLDLKGNRTNFKL